MPVMSVQRFFALAKENPATRGTAVATPTFWLPIAANPTLTPMVNWLKDEGLRGSPNVQYGSVPGARHDEYSFKGNVFLDSFPELVLGTLGAADSVVSTSPIATTTAWPTVPVQGGTGVTINGTGFLTGGFVATGGQVTIVHSGTSYYATYTAATATTLTGVTLNAGQSSPLVMASGDTVQAPNVHTLGLLNQPGLVSATTTTVGASPVALPVAPTAGVALPVTSTTTFSPGGGGLTIVHAGVTYAATYTGIVSGTSVTGVQLLATYNGAAQVSFTPTAGDVVGNGLGYQGSQPVSFTGFDVDNQAQGVNGVKQFTGAMISDLDIEFNAEGAVTYSAKMLSNAYTEVPVTGTGWGGTSSVFVPAWSAAIQVGTVTTTLGTPSVLLSASISIKRNVKPITTVGSQSPYRLWADGITVSGKMSFVVEANDNWVQQALATNYQIVKITFTDPMTGNSLYFQMSKVQLTNPKMNSGKAWLEVEVEFIGEGNTSDAVTTLGNAGGFAPIQVVANNSQSTPY